MSHEIKVALIGLDTSHTIEFVNRMQGPECAVDQRVSGLRAVNCLRFGTPFQNEEGLNNRQKQLESWGIKVTTKFEEAVAGLRCSDDRDQRSVPPIGDLFSPNAPHSATDVFG